MAHPLANSEVAPSHSASLRGVSWARGLLGRATEGEEIVEQLHRRLHTHEHLTGMHKDDKGGNGIGSEVDQVNGVLLQHRDEEGGKWQHQSHHEKHDEVNDLSEVRDPGRRLCSEPRALSHNSLWRRQSLRH